MAATSTATHTVSVALEVGRYNYRAVCSCGWRSGRAYVADHAAQIMADDHKATAA